MKMLLDSTAQVPLFQYFQAQGRKSICFQLCRLLRHEYFRKGQIIKQRDQTLDKLFVVLSGLVGVTSEPERKGVHLKRFVRQESLEGREAGP